jgi:serine/threonine protein kinase/tetratricopeptide (TPR) repeat protein
MNERAIFDAALTIADPSLRSAYLDAACAADKELKEHIEGLLAMHGQLDGFLEQRPPQATGLALAAATLEPLRECAGTVIGPYKLLQQIGEGGFGVVYMAEQTEPVRRLVALKIIKPGMDTKQVVARFEAERQALALMDHPNIAKVIDAGSIPSSKKQNTKNKQIQNAKSESEALPARENPENGENAKAVSDVGSSNLEIPCDLSFDSCDLPPGRPYFVMELVKGLPITTYCDEHNLSLHERLELFIPVCQAVQHAHHKGVIHRDLKPTNVMVTRHDGVPMVKVIDFGVAKATDRRLTEQTLFTAFGELIGTPAYMSPEQAEMSGLDIDTRSDIYSLGVLLYELLTGTTPLDATRLRAAGYVQMQRLIREEEPPRPSTRLSALGPAARALAGQRGTDAKQLARLLTGDLDWIVMKALEKDRNRRYETPAGFAEDVERYLRREPILARPPSTAYRFGKFVQRNRGKVLAAAAIAAALLVGTATATWQAVVATRAQEAAEAQANRTRAVLDFLENKVFAAARPEGLAGGLGRDVTLRQAIEAALPVVDKHFADQPLSEARLRLSLGDSFSYLGEAPAAAAQYERARALYTEHLGAEHPDTLRSMHSLANSYYDLGRRSDALKLQEQTLALRRERLGSDHPDTLVTMHKLANSLDAIGRRAEALKLREQTLALRKAKLGADDPDTLVSMSALAISYTALARRDALPLRERTLALMKAKLGPDHPETMRCRTALADSYADAGRHADALEINAEILRLRQVKLGVDHPDTLGSMNNLANCYGALGQHAEALKLNQQTLKLRRAKLGVDHPDTLASMNNLANSYSALGQHADALKLHEETLKLRQAKLDLGHPDVIMSMNNIAVMYTLLGRHADALKLHQQTLELKKAKFGSDHPETLGGMYNLAVAYTLLGRYNDAIKLGEETLDLQTAKLGPDHPDTLRCMNNLAGNYDHCSRHADAARLYEKTVALRRARLGADHPDTLNSMYNLAISQAALGRLDEALTIHERILRLRRAKLGPDHPDTLTSMNNVGNALAAMSRHTDALAIREETLRRRKATLGPEHPSTLSSMNNLANSYDDLGRHANALELREKTLALRKAKLGPDHPDTLASMNNLANSFAALGRHADAIELHERTLELRRAKLGPDHPDTRVSLNNNVAALCRLGGEYSNQGKLDEAVRLLRRAIDLNVKSSQAYLCLGITLARQGKEDDAKKLDEAIAAFRTAAALDPRAVPPQVISDVLQYRLRIFERARDAHGCRETTEMWEKLKLAGADNIYDNACYRAVTSAAFRAAANDARTADAKMAAAKQADADADRAMTLLKQAVTAGFNDVAHMKQDKDLDALRDRADYQELIAELEFVK